MEEKVFFENGDVRVTSSRFIVGSQTHAMNGVTSVQALKQDPNPIGLLVGVAIGILIFFGLEGWARVFGLLIAIFCGIALRGQQSTYVVLLRSSSGETKALSSQNQDYIDSVVNALNDSIVFRG